MLIVVSKHVFRDHFHQPDFPLCFRSQQVASFTPQSDSQGVEYKIEQTMYLDIMFVNQVPYPVSVVQPIEFLYVSKLADREHKIIWNSLKTSLASMTKYRFRVKMIRVDGEGAINTEWFHNKVGLRCVSCHGMA